jgi:ankyrin repeat protein
MNIDIWNELEDRNIVDVSHIYDENEKLFAIKIYQNDLEYIKANCKKSKNHYAKNSYFLTASAFAASKTIIEMIIDNFGIDINCTNRSGDNCLIAACAWNSNLEIIKYLIEKLKIDISHTNMAGANCLHVACHRNTNMPIIKYLIEEKQMDVNLLTDEKNNCLTLACNGNTNLSIIKYLIEDIKMSTSHHNKYNSDCLFLACNNTNTDVIKYLLEDIRMDINTTCQGYNCLMMAIYVAASLEIIKYLLENTNLKISLCGRLLENITFNTFKDMVPLFTKKYFRLNELLENAFATYTIVDMKNIIAKINPLILNDNVRNLAAIDDPFGNTTYDKFIINANRLECNIPLQDKKCKRNGCDVIERKRASIDFTKRLELLFEHNNKCYYGDKNIVYDAIYLLNDLHKYDENETIVLSGEVPEYIMSAYIQSCYDSVFKMSEVNIDDFETFLKFIDQYPTKYLSIDSLEIDLINYMKSNNFCPNDYIKNICNKYRLKYMYLYFKQKIIFEDQ